MIYSDILFDKACTEKLLSGVQTMARAVGNTMGPTARNVAIAYATQHGEIYQRIVLHDGVSIARAIALKDEFEDMGAQLLKQAAQKMVDNVGDGTSVCVVLGAAIIEEIYTLIAAGVNPMKLRRHLETAAKAVIAEIEKSAIPVKDIKQMIHIATISAEDPVLGEMVANVMQDMGVDGLVAVEESKNAETTVEKQEGMQIEKGWVHELFINNIEKNEAILENPMILVTDLSVTTLTEMSETLQKIADSKKRLVIFTPQIGADAMGAMIQNKLRGVIPSIVIQAPSFGSNQKNMLEDIAILTGATYIAEAAGLRLKDVKLEDFGKCDYINANKTETLIVGGKGKKEMVEARVESIKKSLETEEVEFDREKLKERLGKLTSGVAVIKVGGATEIEMKERLERVKDAKEATKAAMQSGIVPGGEVIYLSAREILHDQVERSRDKDMAYDLLYDALYKPFAKLLSNAGMNDGEWYAYLKQKKGDQYGVDVMDEEIKDMVKSGIIDPAAVPINAIQNALSVAIALATSSTVVIQKLDKETEAPRR